MENSESKQGPDAIVSYLRQFPKGPERDAAWEQLLTKAMLLAQFENCTEDEETKADREREQVRGDLLDTDLIE